MSTPIPGLPRSYTMVRQAGNEYLSRADGGPNPVVSGPCIVSASWSGPQKAELWHRLAGGNWRKLADISGGVGATCRVGAKPGESVSVYVRPAATAQDVADDHRGTITIYDF